MSQIDDDHKKEDEEETLPMLRHRRRLEVAPAILKEPGLLERIINEIGKLVVGEKDAIEAVFLICCGRLVRNSERSSYNLLVNSESGAGKDWLVSRVLEMLSPDIWEKYTRITPMALNYLHANEEGYSWDGKVLYLEDIGDQVLNSGVFKVMASGGSEAVIVDRGKSKILHVEGKPVLILTSATAIPSNEILRRLPMLSLDESMQQSRLINIHRAEWEQNGKPEYDHTLMESIRELRRVDVVVSFAGLIAKIFPVSHLITRTAMPRFMDLIKASAALYQCQRDVDKDGRIIATEEDYDRARRVFLKTTPKEGLVPISRSERVVMGALEGENAALSITELEAKVKRLTDRHIRRLLNSLSSKELIDKSEEHTGGRPRILYSLSPAGGGFAIPVFDELSSMSDMSKSIKRPFCEKPEQARSVLMDIKDIKDKLKPWKDEGGDEAHRHYLRDRLRLNDEEIEHLKLSGVIQEVRPDRFIQT